MITVTIESESAESIKKDGGIIYRGVADALVKTNGSEVHIHSENAQNTEAMHFLMTRLIKWSGGSRPPGRRKTVERKKGWLARTITDVKDQVMDGLTG